MNLPAGITFHPRQRALIALKKPAVISIDTAIEGNDRYKVSGRQLATVLSHLHGHYEDLDQLFHFNRGTDDQPALVEMRAIHEGEPRFPGVTVVPNLAVNEKRGIARPFNVLGSTLGITCRPARPSSRIRQVYELQSYGLVMIDRKRGDVELWVGQSGEKVVIPSDCHFALFNLEEHSPLVALDFGDDHGQSDDELVRRAGPMLLIWYDDLEVVFGLNDLYVNNPELGAGVQIPDRLLAAYGVDFRLPRTSRQDLGTFLHDQFINNSDLIARFARLGISVRRAADEVMLHDDDGGRLFFSRPLANAVTFGTSVYRFFFDAPPASPPEPDSNPGLPPLGDVPSGGPILSAGQTLDRPLVLVVEGAGDWVSRAYRKAFSDKVKELEQKGRTTPAFSIFYADDTQWTNGVIPDWVKTLLPWEVYLDKARAADALVYSLLRPDAVFVVTPDFTHSAIARHWLDKTPVVFVEKPFDVDIRNVEDLQLSFARRRRTEIIGLDHYQSYAQPLQKMQQHVRTFLGGQLASVEFVLAEKRVIEKGRHRALQYGLSLDLLPHLIALLTYFGDIRTIDEISIPRVWRYATPDDETSNDGEEPTPAELFQNETGALIEFTFQDRSRTGFRVGCRAVVGKGFARDAKYLELRSVRGPSLRIDLTETPKDYKGEYPYDSVFIMSELGAKVDKDVVDDPYKNGGKMHILKQNGVRVAKKLERLRYSSLLNDLLNGTEVAAFSSLSMTQGSYIVQVLDRIWWAIQQSKPWEVHAVGALDPVAELKRN